MGIASSTEFRTVEEYEDPWWKTTKMDQTSVQPQENESERKVRIRQELDDFKLELARKHEKRRELIAEKHKEMTELRQQVKQLKEENEFLKKPFNEYEEIERLKRENNEIKAILTKTTEDLGTIEDIKNRNIELKITIANTQKELQDLNSEVMNFEKERQDYKNHVSALKDVITVSKQMLSIRENQLKELKQKVSEIEASLAAKDLTTISQDLQKEYERQLNNMSNLRVFYEERLQAHAKEKQQWGSVLQATKKELKDEQERNCELETTIQRLEMDNSNKYDEIKILESNLGLSKAETRQYQAELTVINQLFSQILLGFSSNQEINIDRLIELLEENHHLLQDIAINEESNEFACALPKTLLDLVREASNQNQMEEETNTGDNQDKSESPTCQLNSASEIVENLPKVWRILIELLSHHCAPVNILKAECSGDPCYKQIQTPKGSQLVLSVSQTFIRLKDLILEKKSLERETGRLKQLNTHLECRLQEQEKRLELVSNEVTDTWYVVDQLQKKHQMLHTQEKILRYELSQRRKLLNTLKEDLESSREKWLEAREKNSTTEREWKQLRNEFASRKKAVADDFNNSLESGYSDERECSSEDEPGYETDISECNQKLSSDEPEAESDIVDKQSEDIQLPLNEPQVESDLIKKTQEMPLSLNNAEAITDVRENKEVPPITDIVQDNIINIVDEHLEVDNQVEDVHKEDSTKNISQVSTNPLEDVLSAREERLKRLEGEVNQLVKEVVSTTDKSVTISNKLDVLHEIYGETSTNNSTFDTLPKEDNDKN